MLQPLADFRNGVGGVKLDPVSDWDFGKASMGEPAMVGTLKCLNSIWIGGGVLGSE